MRPLLREEGKRLGLTGLVSYAVTNHPFTQKAEDHFGSHPCGVALGLWPRSFHNMPAPLTQRMSFVMYFDYVSPAAHVVHAAAPHREMITRIYQQYGISYELCEVAPRGGDRGYGHGARTGSADRDDPDLPGGRQHGRLTTRGL